jgi:hypothetical protein
VWDSAQQMWKHIFKEICWILIPTRDDGDAKAIAMLLLLFLLDSPLLLLLLHVFKK